MACFATVEEKFTRSEPGKSKINLIIINITNTLNASNAENFIIYNPKFQEPVRWVTERGLSTGCSGKKGGGDEGKG